MLAGVAAGLLLSGCASSTAPDPGSGPADLLSTTPSPTAPPSSPTPSPSPTPEPRDEPAPTTADPVISRIGAKQWAAIRATGVWRKGCPVGRSELRRIEVNHHDFDGGVQRGVLVVNADVAESVAGIFTQLFDAGFPIRTMRPMEEYGGDDDVAMLDDDTSGFNCRTPAQANAPSALSPHANGRAIDVNPYENPWIDPRCDCWNPDKEGAPETAPRPRGHHQGQRRVDDLHRRGVDLAGHQDARLHALRHRLSLGRTTVVTMAQSVIGMTGAAPTV